MTNRQRLFLLIGVAIVIAMILFPPYSQRVDYAGNADVSASEAFVPERNLTGGQHFIGYYFIVSGAPSYDGVALYKPGIFMEWWLVQILVVFIVTIYSIYLARDRSDEADESHEVVNSDDLVRRPGEPHTVQS